ncbi:hypothetical protein SBRCBS47491_003488 [Sporothrix bragantina]|uniref:Uncharacterized protein n=1 Tax=Sporothrix bragantina TaxID=671064 RepID=A0ABP0BGW7_9PEZI
MSAKEGPAALIEVPVVHFGGVDIIVNNDAFAVNMPRPAAFVREATLPGGHIVNIVSISARDAPPLQTICASTKGMVESFTDVCAKELPPKSSCAVNAFSTMTDAFRAAGEEVIKVLGPTIVSTPASKRMGEQEEIAYAVQFCVTTGHGGLMDRWFLKEEME